MTSAISLVEKCIDPALIDTIIDKVIEKDKPPVVIAPHPEFDGEKLSTDVLSPANGIVIETCSRYYFLDVHC